MKKIFLTMVWCFVIIFNAYSQTGSANWTWIHPSEYQSLLQVGIDVDWAKTKEGNIHYNSETPKAFYDRGFRHVRIRVKDLASKPVLKMLEQIINDCLATKLIPIIAYQADEFKNEVSEQSMKAAVEWWQIVSAYFKDYSPLLSFDLIIEVTDSLNKRQDKLDEYFEKAVTVIRKTNPNRILFISPRLRSSPVFLNELAIPSNHNDYLMVEWHFYASGPSKTNNEKKWTVGTEEEKKLIIQKIDYAIAFEKNTGLKTWVGAWMPSNYNDENDYTIQEQIEFSSFVAKSLQEAAIPYAINSDTKFYDRISKTWIKEMKVVLDSIILK